MTRRIHNLVWPLLFIVLFAVPSAPSAAAAPAKKRSSAPPAAATPAKKVGIAQNPYIGAIVIDAISGRTLFEDKADAQGYPASVLKLMDLLIILEKIEQKQLTFQDPVVVSAKASKTGGSQVWLAEKETFSVDDLLYALMVQSANDAAVALAEKVAGSTEEFVVLMNNKARQLGMNRTVFHSVHGLPPGKDQQPDVTTPRDFSILCRELLRRPDTLRYTSTRERPFRNNPGQTPVIMQTHNHLLGQVQGCDGLKTGYFTQAGYSMAITAARNGQRIVVVLLGSSDRKVRDAKASELVAKGFASLLAASTASPTPVQTPVPGRTK